MLTTPPIALVPVRDLGQGKTRLADLLPVEGRAALASAMLADVVAALIAADVQRIVVLAAGPVAAASAAALGVDVLLDPPGGRGLDAALAAASRRVRASVSLVVTGDLPTLTAEDVTALLTTPGDVAVAPTRDGGTGGLLRRPAWVMATHYGGRSAAKHLMVARQAGLSAERVDLRGFSLDVDVAEDLHEVAAEPTLGAATARILRDVGATAPNPSA